MDLVGTEMKEFREKLLKTRPAESLKALRSQMTKPERVRMKGTTTSDSHSPADEGAELFDGDGEDLAQSYEEDIDFSVEEAVQSEETNAQPPSNVEPELLKPTSNQLKPPEPTSNQPKTPEPILKPTSLNSTSVNVPNDLNLIKKINDVISSVKKESTNTLLPFLSQIESVTTKARRKVLSEIK